MQLTRDDLDSQDADFKRSALKLQGLNLNDPNKQHLLSGEMQRNDPENPFILSVKDHAIPAVSAKIRGPDGSPLKSSAYGSPAKSPKKRVIKDKENLSES